jgi:hypothetical protein
VNARSKAVQYMYRPILSMSRGTVWYRSKRCLPDTHRRAKTVTLSINGQTYLSTPELALRAGVAIHTVHLWRSNGRAPAAIKHAGRTWFALAGVIAWEVAREAATETTTCRIDACGRPATLGRGNLCVRHAKMVRAGVNDLHGEPPRQRRAVKLKDLLAANTVEVEGHRLWTRRLSGDGYAKVRRGAATRYVHRLVWEEAHGAITDPSMTVDHRCRVRSCVSLEHLRLVERAENIRLGFEARLAEQEAYAAGTLTLDADLEATIDALESDDELGTAA